MKEGVDPMNQTTTRPKWPLWLWGLQLIPATFLLVYALWRLTAEIEVETSLLKSILGLGVGTLWSAMVLLMLALRNGRHWLVARKKELVLSAVATIAGLVAADVALSMMGVVPTLDEQRARSVAHTIGLFSGYRMVPQDILVDDGTTIHINKRGFRGPEISPVKPPGTHRIVFLGGSHVFDYFGGGWPMMVGDELRGRGHKIEVMNAGVTGHSSRTR